MWRLLLKVLIILIALPIFVIVHESTHMVQLDCMGINHTGIKYGPTESVKPFFTTGTFYVGIRDRNVTLEQVNEMRPGMELQANLAGFLVMIPFLIVSNHYIENLKIFRT